jgi:hypothetical protein
VAGRVQIISAVGGIMRLYHGNFNSKVEDTVSLPVGIIIFIAIVVPVG